jgi:protein involved in polysaccharide export with SLBB domain
MSSLLDRAGGIKTAGDLKRSYISRPAANGTGHPTLIAVDLEAILVRRDFRKDKRVQMGDSIVVPPMQHSVRVEGAVARAGLYPYNPNFGISEYLAHAGGRTRSAKDIDDVNLIDPDGQSHGYTAGLKPAPGDSILVPERTFTRPEIVQIGISLAGLLLSGVAITLAATR